jgi:hypothetical protein
MITIEAARTILDAESPLSDEQVARAIESATGDAAEWADEAAADKLPDVRELELDWWVDPDLREAGVNSYSMQRLSFAIARAKAAAATYA